MHWWQGAVIYQVYPRSFADSNGDGVGDLRGLMETLPYIASLGVDAVWISPFFKSPQADFGYDVSDYQAVDPLFGSNEDFKALLNKAHDLGLKILVDLVLSHTSEQHPWFLESRQSHDNAYANWYVWADPKPDGSPPNNWINRFTNASAWTWEPRRRQYYLHNFLPSQPDLNFHNPAVRQAMLDVAKFWLDFGVDGFRFDVVNMYVHDAQLRDNPARSPQDPNLDDVPPSNPLSRQCQVFNRSQPENLLFVEELRQLMDQYPHITSIGEVSDDDNLRVAAEYTQGRQRLHMAYNPYLLRPLVFTDALWRTAMTLTEEYFTQSWPLWTTGNHDCLRLATRWGGEMPDRRLLKLMPALFGAQRGSLLLYQGDELGLPEADIPYALLQDPFGIALWPDYKGRDGCRTPMPWQQNEENAGFTHAVPWLPVPESHRPLAVDAQDIDPNSLLNHWRHFLHWRKTQADLQSAPFAWQESPEGLVAFTRGQTLVILNMTDRQQTMPCNAQAIEGHGYEDMYQQTGGTITLQPYGAFFGTLKQ